MAGSRTPGPQCSRNHPADVNDGTMCVSPMPPPGPLGVAAQGLSQKKHAVAAHRISTPHEGRNAHQVFHAMHAGSYQIIEQGFSRFTALFHDLITSMFPVSPVALPASFSVTKFVQWLKDHAEDEPTGKCAKYVRQGLEAGGLNSTGHPEDARNYGPFLQQKGFSFISPTPRIDYTPKIGDVMVIQPVPLAQEQAGHIQVWCGSYWISDFKQTGASAPWPGPGYKVKKPPYAVYRGT